jgi:hypothetical protein
VSPFVAGFVGMQSVIITEIWRLLSRFPQNVGNTRNMDHLPRKAAGNEWSQPNKEAM